MRILAGKIDVTVVRDGLKGKDSVAVKDGTITVQADGDGIQSSNAEEMTGETGMRQRPQRNDGERPDGEFR